MSRNAYFTFFGDVTIDDTDIKNIFKKIRFKNKFINDRNLFLKHRIVDGQTPESLARYYYNEPELYWIILASNVMLDYHYDWPLRSEELRMYSEKLFNDQQTGGDTLSEIYETLQQENDDKRVIKYLDPARLGDFLFELDKLR
jgi:hypothetical protein